MSKRFQTQPSILLLVQKLKDGCVFMWSYFLYSKIKLKKIGCKNFQQKLTLQPSFSLAAIFYLLPCLKVFSTGVNLPNALWIILIRCGEAEIRSVFQKCTLLTAKLTPERYLKFSSFICCTLGTPRKNFHAARTGRTPHATRTGSIPLLNKFRKSWEE